MTTAIASTIFILCLALGTFIGNWLIIPALTDRTFKDGFWTGVIAAILVVVFAVVFGLIV
jgi:hypothetical protein